MSSPLKAFRKHQKKLIVIFGVLLMVSFTVLGAVQQYLPRSHGQNSGADVVATWKYGEITRGDLQSLRVQQQAATLFMNALVEEATKNGGTPQVSVLGGDSSEMGLAQQMMLAKKAEEMGVVITDDTITQYLAKLTDDTKRSADQFETLYGQILGDRQVNYKGFLQYMRQALLARNMLVMGTAGLSALSPGEAKLYHDRIYRFKRVELLPLAVDDYLSKVSGEPSESEIEKIYDQGQDRYTTPPADEPGFRRRHKIQFGYFKGDADTFQKTEEAKITDDQIAQFYEEHKEDFKRLELPNDLGGDSTGKPDLPGTPIKPIDLPKSDETSLPKKESGSDQKNDDPSGENQPDSSSKEPKTDASEAKPDTSGDKSSDESDSDAPDSKQDDQSRGDIQFAEPTVFVSLDDTAAAGQVGEEAKAATPATEEPAEKKTGEGDRKEAAEPSDAAAPTAVKEKEEPKTEYKSLDEVKDQIRSTLAKQAVIKEYSGDLKFTDARPYQYLRDKALSRSASSLRRYYRDRNRWIANKEQGKSDAEEPTEPNWESVAAENNLTYGKTPLADQIEVGETEIGKLTSNEFIRSFGQQITRTFAQVAFDQDEKLFNASEFPPMNKSSMGPNTNVIYLNSSEVRYLYWKAAEQEEQTPPLSKIRSEVVQAWRLQQARKLAQADAKKKIAEVKGAGKTLAEVFGEENVLKRGFTWLSRGGGNVGFGGGQLDISKVEGVENPGMKFHEAVSLLSEGETGIAMNQPESVVYVVQVERDSLVSEFTNVNSDISGLAGRDQSTIFRDWLEDIERELDVEWKEAAE